MHPTNPNKKTNQADVIINDALLQPFMENSSSEVFVKKLSAFVRQQIAVWPGLKQARELLKKSTTRKIFLSDLDVYLQHNPQRIKSSSSSVDRESIEKRLCFLCPDNLYKKQLGLAYKKDWLILNNPFPVFADHLVVSSLSHQPQLIEKALGTMICFVKDTGLSFTAFYNGPSCGASAPDHLHFQACPDGGLPITGQAAKILHSHLPESPLFSVGKNSNIKSLAGVLDKRALFLCVTPEHEFLFEQMEKALIFIKEQSGAADEPMVNLIVSGTGKNYMGIIFPRRAHRPACYYRKDNEMMIISPGTVDMGGLIIMPRKEDYARMNQEITLKIFSEVSYGPEFFRQLA